MRWSEQPLWEEARSRRIGASEIGTVFGLNPHEDAERLVNRKRYQEVKMETTPMAAGRLLERVAFRRAQALLSLRKAELADGASVMPKEYPWLMATPDAYVCGKKTEVLELKTVKKVWESEKDVPVYLMQVYGLMLATRAEGGVLFGMLTPDWLREAVVRVEEEKGEGKGAEYVESASFRDAVEPHLFSAGSFVVKPRDEVYELIREVCAEFVARYLVGKEKAAKWEPPVRAALDALYGKEEQVAEEVVLPEDVSALASRINDLARTHGELEELQRHLKAYMRENNLSKAVTADRRVVVKFEQTTRRAFTTVNQAGRYYRLSVQEQQ